MENVPIAKAEGDMGHSQAEKGGASRELVPRTASRKIRKSHGGFLQRVSRATS